MRIANNKGSASLEFSISCAYTLILAFMAFGIIYVYSMNSWIKYQNYENIVCNFATGDTNKCGNLLIGNVLKFNKSIRIISHSINRRQNTIQSVIISQFFLLKQKITLNIKQNINFDSLIKDKKDPSWFFY